MLTIAAPSKINLTLEVLKKREDGYHEIRSVIQAIELCDVLSFEAGSGIEVVCDDSSWQADKSLIPQAAALLQKHSSCPIGDSAACRIGLLAELESPYTPP